jgi:hypothetical protein
MSKTLDARAMFERDHPGVLAKLEKATFDTNMAECRQFFEVDQNRLYVFVAVGHALCAGRKPPKWAAEIVGPRLRELAVVAKSKTVTRDDILHALGLTTAIFGDMRFDFAACGGRRTASKRTKERDRARAKLLTGGRAKATQKRRRKIPA